MTLHEEGELSHIDPDPVLGFTCQTVFGFDPNDVDGIHTHKIGVGDGVWFRLKDQRVIDSSGELDDPNPDLYDTVNN